MSQPAAQIDQLIALLLAEREHAGRLRHAKNIRSLDATHVEVNGKPCVNFSSNNYLGLSRHPRLLAAAKNALEENGFGSGSAALICGHTPHHAAAEKAIANWKGTGDAVLLPSGYQADAAAVQTFIATAFQHCIPLRIFMDKLVHASILDAVISRDRKSARTFPHNNLSRLQKLLEESEANALKLVITESIFSMDGDAADLAGLAELKRSHPFVLLLDEAHASGVYGASGSGYASELGLSESVDVSVVTLSKALGGIGGAICGSATYCHAVRNFGRAFIYTTSLPPIAAATASAAIQILHDEPQRQNRLREMSRQTRKKLSDAGIKVLPGDSPILCLVLGEEQKAMSAAETLLEKGMLVAAVRPPTVAPGASRLRITLCSEHTDDEIAQLVTAVSDLAK